jgi:hypothetical protein
VQQPVIQLGTAIHGKSFSGGTLNRFQKLMHVVNLLSVQRSKVGIYHTDSSKPGDASRCGDGHTCLNHSNDETCDQPTAKTAEFSWQAHGLK